MAVHSVRRSQRGAKKKATGGTTRKAGGSKGTRKKLSAGHI